jgi:hypothetical protein
MAESNKFECGGFKFEVARLPPKVSLKGLKLVGQAVIPAIATFAAVKAGGTGSLSDAILRIADGLDSLPEALDLFVPHTKFVGPTGSWVPFEAFVDSTFTGRPEVCVEFIGECIGLEYGRFLEVALAASGSSGLLAKLKNAAGSKSPDTSKTSG